MVAISRYSVPRKSVHDVEGGMWWINQSGGVNADEGVGGSTGVEALTQSDICDLLTLN